ncbi:MAG TPA: hypothetical protein EYG85_09015, partial [Crocinitomix sp.]|nr:hypothetical protein [Crocinitomix sp.]
MRILIITLYYEPLNNIAVTRIKAFKKYLTEFGHHVDILTRHYSEEDMNSSNLDIGLLDGDDLGGEYYKINDVIYSKFKTTNSKLSLSNKLPKGIKGLYNLNQLDVFHYSFVEFGIKAYEKEFKHHTHDLIIASSPAPAVLLLAKEIYKKFGVKWIADFRDSYISGKESKTILNAKKRALTKVLSSSSALLFVSEGMLELNKKYLNPKIFKKPHIIIRNGFYCANDKLDTKVLQQIKNIKS